MGSEYRILRLGLHVQVFACPDFCFIIGNRFNGEQMNNLTLCPLNSPRRQTLFNRRSCELQCYHNSLKKRRFKIRERWGREE